MSTLKNVSFIIVSVLLITITVVNQKIDSQSLSADPNKSISSIDYTANEDSSQENTDTTLNPPTVYTVKEYEGVITVFKEGIAFPVMSQKVQVKSLPQKDRELLEKGVDFSTYKDMLFFLENYE